MTMVDILFSAGSAVDTSITPSEKGGFFFGDVLQKIANDGSLEQSVDELAAGKGQDLNVTVCGAGLPDEEVSDSEKHGAEPAPGKKREKKFNTSCRHVNGNPVGVHEGQDREDGTACAGRMILQPAGKEARSDSEGALLAGGRPGTGPGAILPGETLYPAGAENVSDKDGMYAESVPADVRPLKVPAGKEEEVLKASDYNTEKSRETAIDTAVYLKDGAQPDKYRIVRTDGRGGEEGFPWSVESADDVFAVRNGGISLVSGGIDVLIRISGPKVAAPFSIVPEGQQSVPVVVNEAGSRVAFDLTEGQVADGAGAGGAVAAAVNKTANETSDAEFCGKPIIAAQIVKDAFEQNYSSGAETDSYGRSGHGFPDGENGAAEDNFVMVRQGRGESVMADPVKSPAGRSVRWEGEVAGDGRGDTREHRVDPEAGESFSDQSFRGDTGRNSAEGKRDVVPAGKQIDFVSDNGGASVAGEAPVDSDPFIVREGGVRKQAAVGADISENLHKVFTVRSTGVAKDLETVRAADWMQSSVRPDSNAVKTVGVSRGDTVARALKLADIVVGFDRFVSIAANRAGGGIVVGLIPENLGKITMTCREENGKLSLDVVVMNGYVRNYLMSHENQLKSVAESNGFQISQFNVRTDGGGGGDRQDTDSSAGDNAEQFGRPGAKSGKESFVALSQRKVLFVA